MDQKIFKEKSWQIWYGFGIELGQWDREGVIIGPDDFEMSLRHKYADWHQRRQIYWTQGHRRDKVWRWMGLNRIRKKRKIVRPYHGKIQYLMTG